jgi:mannosyltransferase
VAGAALRLPFLAHQSLWVDETFTRDIALAPQISDVWSAVKATESTPPLFYWLEWLVSHGLGSSSAAALRLLPAVAGTLTVPVAFFTFRRFGMRVALAVAWLCAVSPVLVWYSLDARSYSLFILLGLVNFWALLRALERPDAAHCAAWALTALLCIWTHYFGVFFVAGEILFVAVAHAGTIRRRILGWSVPVALGAAPLIPLVTGQSGDARRAFIESKTLRTQLEQTVRQFGMGPNVPSAVLEGAGIALLGLAVVVGIVTLARRRDRTAVLMVVVILVTVLPPLLLTAGGIDKIFYTRNVLVVWPLIAAFAAFGLLRARGVPLLVYVALAIATILAIQADWRYQNVDWAAVNGQIRDRIGNEPALVYPGYDSRVAAAYLHRSPSPGPITAKRLAVIVEPARTGRRELQALPQFPGTPVPRLSPTQTIALPHGFRLILYDAPAPQPIGQAGWQPDVAHGPPWFVLAG